MLPKNDNWDANTYAALMAEEPAHILLNIDYSQPIEVLDFISLFTSIEDQFDRYLRDRYPDIKPQTQVFVKEIGRGSIEADLIATIGAIIPWIEHAVVLEDFVRRYGERLGRYFNLGGRDQTASKGDLKDFMGAVTAIAKDPNGASTISAARYVDGKKMITATVRFDTKQARVAADEIEHHRRELEQGQAADYERALMTFVQSNIKNATIGKRTGEWVVIEDISEKSLPLVYASELAEQRIKYETREAEDNLYKKGFIVDVNLQMKGGRPVAYRVTNVHQVIDLPDEPEGGGTSLISPPR